MRATDPIVTFVLVLVIGIAVGILFDRLAGPSWLARQFSGSTRGTITCALVGVAGAFVGYHIAVLLALEARWWRRSLRWRPALLWCCSLADGYGAGQDALFLE